MNTGNPRPGPDQPAEARQKGVASAPHQPLRRPEDGGIEDALQGASLADGGAGVEDHMRDRHSKGVAGDYDDSVERGAARTRR